MLKKKEEILKSRVNYTDLLSKNPDKEFKIIKPEVGPLSTDKEELFDYVIAEKDVDIEERMNFIEQVVST